MQNAKRRLSVIFVAIALPSLVQACAAAAVGDAVVGSTVFVTKTAVKGTVAAGRFAYRGGRAVVRGATGGTSRSYANTNYNDRPYTGGPQGDAGPSCFNPDGSYSPALRDANGKYFCP